ncbi:hypothetical protein P691DRAFT_813281 [Macrolepiota fuliginosa MF-IS2]|uniref:Uncharacterized protein n=1 Tax=Macrolepiota fuliginosa MF-IS2 TaxID=1400762 RepID=A0A9P6C1Y1_9AGAR|nr:hypothetical protein P691DRAFT_813281 [Macrolepiota fuliginosa MF-IS2]
MGSTVRAIQTPYPVSSAVNDNLIGSIWSFGLLNALWLLVGGYWAYMNILGRIGAARWWYAV